jgi:hypothetical protein
MQNQITNTNLCLWFIILIITLFLFRVELFYNVHENFYDFQYPSGNCFDDIDNNLRCINTPIYTPFWANTRFTRNMSYDLRGDEPPIPPQEFIWNNSSIVPNY